jgi:hypothetical protein
MAGRNGVQTQTTAGYRIPETTARIIFDGTDYDGAEVFVRLNVSFRHYLALREAAEGNDQAWMAELFGGEVLMSWNLEDSSGAPVPADGDGMLQIPLTLAMMIVQHWVEAVADVPNPLEEPSADISTLAAASTVTGTG